METCITLLINFVRKKVAKSTDTIAYIVSCIFYIFPFITFVLFAQDVQISGTEFKVHFFIIHFVC